MKLVSRIAGLMPDPLLYRSIAASFRLRSEQRLLFVDDLVRRGCTAVDIGAWWGPWTYWLTRRAATVWAFEPNPRMASFLRRVVPERVHVEAVALSDRDGEAELYVPAGHGPDALATLSAAHRKAGASPVTVALRTLDSYELTDVGFIKVDVEGHEREALAGAKNTIARCRPVILVEIEQMFHDEPIEGLFSWLEAQGYRGKVRRNRSWAPISTFDVERDQRQVAHDPRSLQYINNFVFEPRAE